MSEIELETHIDIYTVKLVKEKTVPYNLSNAIRSPECAYGMVEEILNLSTKTREHIVMMSLNTKNQVIGLHTIHIGTICQSLLSPRDILQQALLNNATSIMLFHNHPSGNPEISTADKSMTQKLQQACRFMDIALLDHIIIGSDSFQSHKQLGYL